MEGFQKASGHAPDSPDATTQTVGERTLRCINVVNFIRAVEPRFKMDTMLPVTQQMQIIKKHDLPATWLLQFDALVSGPFVPYLKANKAHSHEVGLWFEMNEMHCKAAGVRWRGRPDFEWDPNPAVAFTIGYTHEERKKLADTAMARFKVIWGHYPRSVASWNLDAFTMSHMTDRYGIDAYAVCRDQIATDGFSIWGAPIAGYYPSRLNCWSPAVNPRNQTSTPVFRMLGQDPVYYYQREWTLPDGESLNEPDTMEPAWTAGQSPQFVSSFLQMITRAPAKDFSYCQLGQENTFEWHLQQEGYKLQMDSLSDISKLGQVHVETLGASGRRFKRTFKVTPPQAQVQLQDPFGNTSPAQQSIWYQSRFYRANLHFKGNLAYLRDVTVYSDSFEQPFLYKPTCQDSLDQIMPPILDGYHWSKGLGTNQESGAFFLVHGAHLRVTGEPRVSETDAALVITLPISGSQLHVCFDEQTIYCILDSELPTSLTLSFEWDPSKAASVAVHNRYVFYQWQNLEYGLKILEGTAQKTKNGWLIDGEGQSIRLSLAQSR